jgi:hypothetical protein
VWCREWETGRQDDLTWVKTFIAEKSYSGH